MAGKIISLVTGGNGGIGFEIAVQLIGNATNHVIIGSRSAEKGEAAVKDLESRGSPGSVEMLQLDVSSYESVVAAAKAVEEKHGRLDILVNNAAVASFPDGTPMHEQLRQCFATNATGPYMMGEAFGPLLMKSTSTARIVNVSSGAGSISRRLDTTSPMYGQSAEHYRASKAALNMIHACQTATYGKHGIKVFTVCPGFTVSKLGPHNNAAEGAKPVAEGAMIIVRVIDGERDDEHGCFLNGTGQYGW